MCSYKQLAHNKTGYVIECNQCGHIQIAFGTSALKLLPEVYEDFYLQIGALMHTRHRACTPESKVFHVDLYNKTSLMILNQIELEDLFNLLSEANFSLEVESVLSNNRMN